MYKCFIKRLLDLVVSILCLPMFGVIFVVIAPIIKVTDGGPIFYHCIRIGKDSKLFIMYKFRTMNENAPDIRLSDGSTFNSKDDPRVTKIGHFLRKTSLDEIPQIINVIKGEMSLIGPRPDPPDWLDRYPMEYREFLEVRPGITGYNQAYFRNTADGIEKMKHDYYYAKQYSFFMDLKIFMKTVSVVMKRENIYKK